MERSMKISSARVSGRMTDDGLKAKKILDLSTGVSFAPSFRWQPIVGAVVALVVFAAFGIFAFRMIESSNEQFERQTEEMHQDFCERAFEMTQEYPAGCP